MNISQYNQALNKAMSWTAKLEEISGDELESLEQKLERLVDTDTEFGEVKVTDKKGATILWQTKNTK